MQGQPIEQFIKSLGGLHDATLTNLHWYLEDKRLEFGIEDIYSNFHGLPNYPGATKGKFIFSDVKKLIVEVKLSEVGLIVFDWTVTKDMSDNFCSEIRFSPGGLVVVECAHIECVKR